MPAATALTLIRVGHIEKDIIFAFDFDSSHRGRTFGTVMVCVPSFGVEAKTVVGKV